MKRDLSKIIFILTLCMGFSFYSCEEEATLAGADKVYITIDPAEVTLSSRDTVQMYAYVQNLSGDTIRTSMKWDSDDERVVYFEGDRMIAQDSAKNKRTTVRVTLPNGDYALTTVTVVPHGAAQLEALVDQKISYQRTNDTLWFSVTPLATLLDYKPVVRNSNPELVVQNPEDSIFIDYERGLIGYVFDTPRSHGEAKIDMLFGPPGNEAQAEAKVVVSPAIVSTLGDDFNSITYEFAKTMDINQVDTVWVNTKVDPTYELDLANAAARYNWNVEGAGGQLMALGQNEKKDVGHNAYAVLRSGPFAGQTKVLFECNGTLLTTTVDVQNYATQYPVDTLKVSRENIVMSVGETTFIIPTVVPITSYGFHVPKFVSQNEDVVKVVGYKGQELIIQAVGMGETELLVTSNDKRLTVKVAVTDRVESVILGENLQRALFEGQSTQWTATVKTTSGKPISPNWSSSEEAIATISSEGLIEAKSVGVTMIVAEAGGVKTNPTSLNVLPFPTGEFVYGENNASADLFTEDGNGDGTDEMAITLVTNDDQDEMNGVKIKIARDAGFPSVEDGEFTVGDGYALSVEFNGASATATAGGVSISANPADDWMKLISGEITFSLSGKSFTIRLTNLPAYF